MQSSFYYSLCLVFTLGCTREVAPTQPTPVATKPDRVNTGNSQREPQPATDTNAEPEPEAKAPSAAGSSSPKPPSAPTTTPPPAAAPAAGSSSPKPPSAPTTTPPPAAGSGGGPAAGAAAPPASPPRASTSPPIEPQLERGPYFTSGSWHGYFWLAQNGAGTTLAATGFDAETFTAPICVDGIVVATPNNTANAMLGVNLNQTNTSDMTMQAVAPKLDGITVSITNKAGSPVRVQIQALDGATNARARWCAELRGSGGFIPWSAFNTACWDGSGNPYQREPISGAMLLIPGAPDKPITFDLCLNSLSETNAS